MPQRNLCDEDGTSRGWCFEFHNGKIVLKEYLQYPKRIGFVRTITCEEVKSKVLDTYWICKKQPDVVNFSIGIGLSGEPIPGINVAGHQQERVDCFDKYQSEF